jgi:transposase InsO family protein
VYRWRRRGGEYEDRSSRPRRSPRRTPDGIEATVLALRLERHWGPDRIAGALGMHPSTVHRVLRRHGAHRLSHLFPKPPRSFGRFDVSEPGELVAVDVKKVGRLDRGGGSRGPLHSYAGRPHVGWRYLHVAIDLASRLAYVEPREHETSAICSDFLAHAIAAFDARGIRVRRVLTDNGVGYRRRSRFDERCAALGIRHTRTRPYHPWTNGRVERFIGTLQRECIYGRAFTSEDERDLELALYVAYYNGERPHTALGGSPPLKWLTQRPGVTQVGRDFN